MKSLFIEGRSINGAQRAFEHSLLNDGYEPAFEYYPGAVPAADLAEEYLCSVAVGNQAKSVRQHAKDIGFVSDYKDEDEDD